MRVPEIVYQLARSPQSTGPMLELFAARAFSAVASTTVSALINGPPKDRVLVLTNVTVDLNPGATQAITRVVISARTPALFVYAIAQIGFDAVADLRTGFNWQGEVAIGGPGVDIRSIIVDCVFDAGVNTNGVTANAFGYVIPRGNIAPF